MSNLSNFSQAKAYSSKEDTRVSGPWSFGDDAGISETQGERSDLLKLKRKIDEGVKDTELWQEHFSTMIHNHRAMKVYKRTISLPRRHEMEIITLVGDTGTGKTRWANEMYPSLYTVPPSQRKRNLL